MSSGWRDAFKFLSGASFVASGASLYFYWLHVAVPFPFLGFKEASPELLGIRGAIQFALFLLFFYLGFLRK